jgi:hypothetical protein
MQSLMIWLTAAILAGATAGLLAITCNRVAKFSRKQKVWLPIITAAIAWIAAGAIAHYGFRTTPWGWPAGGSSLAVAFLISDLTFYRSTRVSENRKS